MWQQKWFLLTFRNIFLIATTAVMAMPGGVAAIPLTVVTEEFPPYNYAVGDKLEGYATEVVQAALQRSKIAYSIHSYPWARAFQMASSQPDVLIYSIVRTPERERQFYWIAPLAPRNVYLYKLASRRDIRVKTLADLRPYRIAANRGDAVEDQLRQLDLTADLGPLDETSLRKLLAGRVDLMVSSELVLKGICEQAKVSCAQLERTMIMPGMGDYYVAASLGTPSATVRALRAEFGKLRNSDFLQRTAEKYGVSIK